ncbi:MAG: YwbE family protein [Acidobacteriota bacterium]|nr:YwbE family protein [Acidobacteriota bacterium]
MPPSRKPSPPPCRRRKSYLLIANGIKVMPETGEVGRVQETIPL